MANGSGKAKKWIAAGLAVAALGSSVWWGPKLQARWWPHSAARQNVSAGEAALRYATVKRGELRVAITEEGKLRAVKSHAIYPQLRGRCKITWLAAEGATVKKGEKLVTFDTKEYEDQLQTRKADVEQQKRALVVAEEALKIQESTAKALVVGAETKLADAEVALKVYREMEGPKKLSELETAINEARTKHTTAAKTYADAQARAEGGMFLQDEEQRKAQERELATAKAAVGSTKKALDAATLERKIYRAYTYPQQLKVKQQAVANATLDLEKARVQARSEVLQKQSDVARLNDLLTRLGREIDNLNDQLSKSEITAPVDGMVLYGDANQPAYYRSETVKVGMDWYSGNTLMTIPDLSAFEIDLSIPEEARGKIAVGCKTLITMEAIPGLSTDGELTKIDNLARGRVVYDPNSPKVFSATVKPNTHDARMVSGMTARVEIVADVLKDVLLVPIEAVINEGGDSVCYVKNAAGATERRKVKCGKSNDHFVAIEEGLSEGDQVDLTPVRGTSSEDGGGHDRSV